VDSDANHRGRLEGLVVDSEALAAGGETPSAGVSELLTAACELGLHLVVIGDGSPTEIAEQLSVRAAGPGSLTLVGGSAAREVSAGGALHVVAGAEALRRDRSRGGRRASRDEARRWAVGELWRLGLGSGQIMVVVVPDQSPDPSEDQLHSGHPAGSSERFPGSPVDVVVIEGRRGRAIDILAGQVQRRKRGEAPRPPADRAWALAIEGVDAELEAAHESCLAIADTALGTRGIPLGEHPAMLPAVFVAGVFQGSGGESELVQGPIWNLIRLTPSEVTACRRLLDLRTGILHHELTTRKGWAQATMFSSLARPGTVALRFEGAREVAADGPPLVLPGAPGGESGDEGGGQSVLIAGEPGGLAAAARQRAGHDGDADRIERLGFYSGNAERQPELDDALQGLAEAEARGFEALLNEHRATWARRWESADVRIEGDPELERTVRFALFHLIATAASGGEAAVGARGLSGPGYRGHVFWDACVYVLPFLAATHPPAARAMLEYRIRRLEAAKEAARRAGRDGARFPWESAATGQDVTPTSVLTRTGERVPVRTGELEEHIVADIAWGASCYLDWSGDDEFRRGDGAALLTETARYWASRVERDEDGLGHIRGVIGPDEYHVDVDDNAYTNVMARWNLRRAAGLDGGDAGAEERREWLRVADTLIDRHDAQTGLYEQFDGFFDLEPLVIRDLAPHRPIAADLLLGRDRVAGAQVIKQADVLMLHHLVRDQVAAGSLEPNLLFYEPRTAHASSLSPGIHAALFARAGCLEDAMRGLQLAANLDLHDLSETTAAGCHLAAMGSVWQALALGFAGVRPDGDVLRIDPRLPKQWSELELRLRFRGTGLTLRLHHDRVEVAADGRLSIGLAGERAILIDGGEGFKLLPSPEGGR
jgi:trehalose/maltose hydrolase-like predicted phosphorylase